MLLDRIQRIRQKSLRAGTAAVELALVMPLIVTVLLGILEMGRTVQVMQVLDNAAREGARQASTSTATLAQIKTNVQSYIQNAEPSITDFTGYDLQYANITSPTVTDPTAANQLDRFTMTVVLPFDNIRWTWTGQFMRPGTTLQATVNWYSLRDLPVQITTSLPGD